MFRIRGLGFRVEGLGTGESSNPGISSPSIVTFHGPGSMWQNSKQNPQTHDDDKP